MHLQNEPQLVAKRFKPSQLTQAREYLGMTKRELAEKIGKSPAAITQFEMEQGGATPEPATLAQLSLVLRVPVSFFGHTPLMAPFKGSQCHFRSMKAASQRGKNTVLAEAWMLAELSAHLHARYDRPRLDFAPIKETIFDLSTLEDKATYLRQAFGMGLNPIPKLAWNLENKGIQILPLAKASKTQAFSCWHVGWPIMFISWGEYTSSRCHFDMAHELAHLVLHDDVEPGDWDLENEANNFASAFLMPKETFAKDCPRTWSLQGFLELKQRWRVSLRAAIRRARDLGLIAEYAYKRGNIELSQAGYTKDEPGEWKLAEPALFKAMLEAVIDEEGITTIANDLCVHPQFIEQAQQLLKRTYSPMPNPKNLVLANWT